MKNLLLVGASIFLLAACTGETTDEEEASVSEETEQVQAEEVTKEPEKSSEEEVEATNETEVDVEAETEEIEEDTEVLSPEDYNPELTYDDLARNPSDHLLKPITFEGKIIQVIQGDGVWQYRIATNDNYDKVMLLEIEEEKLESRILEDDYIRFYGYFVGEITYESAMGGSITIPGVLVEEFEFL